MSNKHQNLQPKIFGFLKHPAHVVNSINDIKKCNQTTQTVLVVDITDESGKTKSLSPDEILKETQQNLKQLLQMYKEGDINYTVNSFTLYHLRSMINQLISTSKASSESDRDILSDKTTSDGDKLMCSEVVNGLKCGRKYSQRSALNRHMKTHSAKVQCSNCKKKFSRSDVLRVHKERCKCTQTSSS